MDSASSSLPRLPVLSWEAISIRRRLPLVPVVTASRDAVFVSSGRAAILFALELLGIGAGDRVLVPTYHCPTMIAPVTRLGATPMFYPIDRFAAPNLDWLATVDTSGVKALLAVHFFGLPLTMEAVKAFCAARNIALLEDCAHAYVGSSGRTPVGAYGDLAIASLPKFFPVVEGGCLVGPSNLLDRLQISSPPWVAQLRAVADSIEIAAGHGRFGIVGKLADALASLKRQMRSGARLKAQNGDEPDEGDFRTWLDENLLRRRAAASTQWIVKHTDLTRMVERRRANYADWVRLMEGVECAEALFPSLPDSAAPYVFPLRVRDPEAKYRAVRASGIPVFRWDIVWPGTPRIAGDEGEAWQTGVFQLACHQDLASADIARMAETVRREVELT